MMPDEITTGEGERENRGGPRPEPWGPPTFRSEFLKVTVSTRQWIRTSVWRIMSTVGEKGVENVSVL